MAIEMGPITKRAGGYRTTRPRTTTTISSPLWYILSILMYHYHKKKGKGCVSDSPQKRFCLFSFFKTFTIIWYCQYLWYDGNSTAWSARRRILLLFSVPSSRTRRTWACGHKHTFLPYSYYRCTLAARLKRACLRQGWRQVPPSLCGAHACDTPTQRNIGGTPLQSTKRAKAGKGATAKKKKGNTEASHHSTPLHPHPSSPWHAHAKSTMQNIYWKI